MGAAKDSIFSQTKMQEFQKLLSDADQKQKEAEASAERFRNQVRLYSLIAVACIFLILLLIVYRNNRQKQKAYTLITKQKQETDIQKLKVEQAYQELKSTQNQLIQSEKMASLGELTAGIAHEIQNPLNFVNNFSEVNTELIEELNAERLKPKAERNEELENEILNDIKENEGKINHHGKRADAIVKGMLQHSRSSTGVKEPTDINALTDEYLRLSYHGLRAKDNSFNATMKTDFDKSAGKINIIPQDIGRVLLNLYNNAFYAISERQKAEGLGHAPTISVSTKKSEKNILITVRDNGSGIPQKIIDKIFQPFFTTKPTGQGTGLGLSLSYDIIKAHGGEIKIETKEGEGTTFIIQLPVV
jgi:signal transduction histidine kinase